MATIQWDHPRNGPALAMRRTAFHLPAVQYPSTVMFKWLTRRRLSPEAQRKLLLLSARAEEALVETHVRNLLDLLRTLGEEVDLDRGIQLYVEMVSLDESMAATVTNRALARLEQVAERGGRDARRYRHVLS